MKEELIKLLSTCNNTCFDNEYVQDDVYKNIDKIYVDNPIKTTNLLYSIALDVNNISDFKIGINESAMSTMRLLLVEHRKNKDDVTYIESIYKKMVKQIFAEEKYLKFKIILDELLWYGGFTKNEIGNLYGKYVEIETDPDVIKKYKYELLEIDLRQAFPDKVFGFMSVLELGSPRTTNVATIQKILDSDVRDYGADVVIEYIKMLYNHKYTKEHTKIILKQLVINGDTLW